MSSESLSDLRKKIDEIDAGILAAINDRARLAHRVASAKGEAKSAADYYRPEREAQVLRRIKEINDGPLADDVMLRLFREVMSACLAQQGPLKVAFLGPEGTFSHTAAMTHFGHSIRGLPLSTIEEVFMEVDSRSADFGIVPVENSSGGAVSNTLDMFIDSPLRICGEMEMRIVQNLISKAGSYKHIERIYSHQQSLAQCRNWLRQNLGKAERISVSSNAEAARRVRNDPYAAAIAGESAAEIYGLNVLAEDIADQVDNTTRFVIIGRELLNASGDDKTSLLLAHQEQPGALYHLLQPLATNGLSMTRIESRPSRLGKWDYVFFVDVAGHVSEPKIAKALKELESVATLMRVLGSYPVAVN